MVLKCSQCGYMLRFLRKNATQAKVSVEMPKELVDNIQKKALSIRKHPGILKQPVAQVPERVVNAIRTILKDAPVRTLVKEAAALENYLIGRRLPNEPEDVAAKAKTLMENLEAHYENVSNISEEAKEYVRSKIKAEMHWLLKKKLYNWQPVEYNKHVSRLYLLGRFAPEYAVLRKIFTEIKTRDPEFCPETMLDFGSGVGTATWAAKTVWGEKSVTEHYNVDSSREMNELASLLLRDGNENIETPLTGVYYRQFLPARHDRKYDIVVSAYSLLELPSAQKRLETILNLWNKTKRYLVLVEQGSIYGFHTTNEGRDLILYLTQKTDSSKLQDKVHVFSPCPHEKECPRFIAYHKPCSFGVKYVPLPFFTKPDAQSELFSYIVLQKGERPADDPQWPRIVRPVLVRKKHTVCRMCMNIGKLQEIIFTAFRHGKVPYQVARSSKWGDLLPMAITEQDSENKI